MKTDLELIKMFYRRTQTTSETPTLIFKKDCIISLSCASSNLKSLKPHLQNSEKISFILGLDEPQQLREN
jgi:hypothetical protein